MKVVVTGGSGRLGRFVTRELARGHDVTVFDRIPPADRNVRFVEGDITNIQDCRKCFDGHDAVIHLAAIPDPMNDPPETVFRVNAMGTFNVYQAACDLGMRKVVYASTNSVYGFHFRKKGEVPLPAYLPIDEDHPQVPADTYGLSKKVGEEIAQSFARQYGLPTVAIRICWVWFPENRSIYVASAEDPGGGMGYWSWVDCRDAATAFRLALEAEGLRTFESFLVSSSDNSTLIDSRELMRTYFTDELEFRRGIDGRDALFDIARAKAFLGYSPQHTVNEYLEGN